MVSPKCSIKMAILAYLFVSHVLGNDADVCTQGEYNPTACDKDGINYRCLADLQPSDEALCISSGLCCCRSRDGLFSSGCKDEDICCDGGCCDPVKSFCCGGGCCDVESEVCCRDECVGKPSSGTRVAFPLVVHILLALLAYCSVVRAPKDLRVGRLTSLALLVAIVGFIQMLVALSAWDCSGGLKAVAAFGAIEAAVGIGTVIARMAQAAAKGEGVLAVFATERVIVAVVDSQSGNVQAIGVADQQTAAVARTELSRKEGGRGQQGGNTSLPKLRLTNTTETEMTERTNGP